MPMPMSKLATGDNLLEQPVASLVCWLVAIISASFYLCVRPLNVVCLEEARSFALSSLPALFEQPNANLRT